MSNTVTIKFINDKGPNISDDLGNKLEHKSFYTPVFNQNTQEYVCGLTQEELKWAAKKLKMSMDDINPVYSSGDPHPFWDSTRVRAILKSTTVMNLDNALDFIKYKYLVANGIVAPTEEDLSKDDYINALYFVSDSEEAEKIKASKVTLKANAYTELGKLSREKVKQVATILEKEPMSADTDEYCLSVVGQHIEKNPERFLSVVNMKASEIAAMATIEEACARKIMDKKPYMYNGKELGPTVEEAAKSLSSKINAELYSKLKKQLASE